MHRSTYFLVGGGVQIHSVCGRCYNVNSLDYIVFLSGLIHFESRSCFDYFVTTNIFFQNFWRPLDPLSLCGSMHAYGSFHYFSCHFFSSPEPKAPR